MQTPEQWIARWQTAGLLTPQTAAAIRAYEAEATPPATRQWQVLLALILGAILLGAGVLLFVAAHWDSVSPTARFAMVLTMLAFFHLLGLFTRDRFPGFAIAMHALGTIAAGAAIALTGQIFNMQEHWPAAVLLWAIAAAAGWYLLRDQFQQTLTLLLIPAWLASELSFRMEPYTSADVYLARLGLVLGAAFLVAFLHSTRRATYGILFGVGALLLPISAGILTEGWRSYDFYHRGSVPLNLRIACFVLTAIIAAVAFLAQRTTIVPIATAFLLGMALPWAQHTHITQANYDGIPYTESEPNLLAHALVALAAVVLILWGVRILSKALVNYGMACFAAAVIWFYFSSVMDKLGRSLGLIALGILFLGGGWALERTRRRLLGTMQEPPA